MIPSTVVQAVTFREMRGWHFGQDIHYPVLIFLFVFFSSYALMLRSRLIVDYEYFPLAIDLQGHQIIRRCVIWRTDSPTNRLEKR
jgi:hypothetical protein